MEINNFLIIAGLIAIFSELILGVASGFDIALLGTSLVIGGTTGFIFKNNEAGIIASIILSLIYIFFGKKLIKNKLTIKTSSTNIDNLIGKYGICTKAISENKTGQVKISNEFWRAESEKTIEKDMKVKVLSVEGVTLHVVKA